MGNLFITIQMEILLTITMGFLFTIVVGIQFALSTINLAAWESLMGRQKNDGKVDKWAFCCQIIADMKRRKKSREERFMSGFKNKKSFLFLLGLAGLSSLAGGAVRFTDVSLAFYARGSDYWGGHGANWIDVNGDGMLDIYVKNVAGKIYNIPNTLLINYGTYFSDEAVARGVKDTDGLGTHGAVLADYDNDLDFDLFSTTTFHHTEAYNHLYMNDGAGFFTDVTSVISPAQTENTEARGVAAADLDGDGHIDFYFSNPVDNTDYNKLFSPVYKNNFLMNDGDGTFTAENRGIAWSCFTQGVSAVDVDGDGDIDLAEARWKAPSTIYLNDGSGQFTDAGAGLGLPQDLDVRDNGMTFADIDTDGSLDLAVIGAKRVAIYKQYGGQFSWSQTLAITRDVFHGCFGDFDHDGDLDLYVSGGNVYENDGTGLFTELLPGVTGLQPSLDTLDPRGSALADFDNDGDLDIYVTDADYYNILLRNDLNDDNWIKVEVWDHTGGVGGIGTKLDLYATGHANESAYLRGHREIQGEYGYLSQDMPVAHFGAPSPPYDLKVTFADGTVRTFMGLTSGQTFQALYPSVQAPLNLTGERKINKALFYWESLIILNWQQNPANENIFKYRIYEVDNSTKILLDEVDGDTFSYMLRQADKNRTYVLEVRAVNSLLIEGKAATVIVN